MTETNEKPVHTLVLDAAPLLKNTPPLSTLLARSHTLVTCPSVFKEIRDATARHRVESLYLPFLVLRSPQPESLKIVSEFARETGDKSVLSNVDLEVLALAYELECEGNGGNWRLRSVPGQKQLNGELSESKTTEEDTTVPTATSDAQIIPQKTTSETPIAPWAKLAAAASAKRLAQMDSDHSVDVLVLAQHLEETQMRNKGNQETSASPEEQVYQHCQEEQVDHSSQGKAGQEPEDCEPGPEHLPESDSDSDSEGWITPSNIKKKQALESKSISTEDQKVLQVATITTDFAMQNILLQMNLNLLSATNLQRVRNLRTHILRCYACFYTTKELEKQFCPRCGKPALTRVSCSTNAKGEFKLHLKRNFQYNSRGDKYSIPKPVHGSSNGKLKNGGGKDGWGKDLILAEDQKEYINAINSSSQRSRKERDLMDEDYLPGILTGERRLGSGRVKVGAGRNVNSRKR